MDALSLLLAAAVYVSELPVVRAVDLREDAWNRQGFVTALERAGVRVEFERACSAAMNATACLLEQGPAEILLSLAGTRDEIVFLLLPGIGRGGFLKRGTTTASELGSVVGLALLEALKLGGGVVFRPSLRRSVFVEVDGQPSGEVPEGTILEVRGLSPGRHQLRLKGPLLLRRLEVEVGTDVLLREQDLEQKLLR